MRARYRARCALLYRLRQAESGAMALFIALTTCFVVIPLGALAVDLGMQRLSRVDAQAVADTTALDMAQSLAINGSASVTDAAATADAAKTSGAIGNGMTVKVYLGTLTNNYVSDQSLGCNGTTSNAYFVSGGSTPTAVLVTVSNSVNFAIQGGSGGVCRSSLASVTTMQKACATMDSYAAALNTGDSKVLGILNQMLGTNLSSQVLSSSGILTAGVKVLDFLNVLRTNLGLASADQVLAANVTAAQVNAAMLQVLNNNGNTASVQVLQTIGATINSTTLLSVGNLLGLSSGQGSALATTVNPLDLVAAAAQVANGSTPLSATVTSPPSSLTGLTASVSVGSAPQQFCLGGPKVTMGQTSITASANIDAPATLTSAVTNLFNGLSGILSSVVQGLGSVLGGDTYTLNSVTLGTVSAKITLASASGQVTSLSCNGGTPTGIGVAEGSSLVPATITVPFSVSATHGYGGLAGIGRQYENATAVYALTITTAANGTMTAAVLPLPNSYTTPQNGPSNNLSLQNLNVSVVNTNPGTFAHGSYTVDQLFLKSSTSVLNEVQSTILSPIESLIMTPLFNSLTSTLQQTVGTTIAGSTYLAQSASCIVPKLVG